MCICIFCLSPTAKTVDEFGTVALLVHELLAEIHVDQAFIHLQRERGQEFMLL